MTRKAARELAIQLSFAASATARTSAELAEDFFSAEHFASLAAEDPLYAEAPDDKQLAYILRLTSLIDENKAQIDACIERYARGWKLERLSRTALAVLRCAVCEILYMEEIPNAAAINEAVELDKHYDGEETVAFVNGVLGSFMRGEVEAPGEGES